MSILIPKGSIIKIGQNERGTISRRAIGLCFVLDEDVEDGEKARDCDIIENPNGWHLGHVTHRINLKVDRIIAKDGLNAIYSGALERMDD